jgi:CheY-like chemotaxis protein
MVYGFAKQSGGHVKIESQIDRGTLVCLYLPRVEQMPQVAPERVPSNPTGSEQILLVEDDDLVRSQVLNQLTSMGYCVTAVQNGAEALALLRQRPKIDLLFTDIVMPGGLNGRELAQQAWRLIPDLPVLFTSGYANDELREGGLDRAIQFLRKPYSRRELGTKIRLAVGQVNQTAGI